MLTPQVYTERSIWIRPRSSDFWDCIVNRTFNQNDWYENFKMRKKLFNTYVQNLICTFERKILYKGYDVM